MQFVHLCLSCLKRLSLLARFDCAFYTVCHAFHKIIVELYCGDCGETVTIV